MESDMLTTKVEKETDIIQQNEQEVEDQAISDFFSARIREKQREINEHIFNV